MSDKFPFELHPKHFETREACEEWLNLNNIAGMAAQAYSLKNWGEWIGVVYTAKGVFGVVDPNRMVKLDW